MTDPHDPPPAGPEDYGAPAPRTLPANGEIEQALLGILLVDNAAYDQVADLLLPRHFADALHGRIFEACAKLIERGQTASVLSLRATFEADEPMPGVTGPQYLVELTLAAGGTRQAGQYAETLVDLYRRREAILGFGETVEELYDVDLDRTAEAIIEAVQGDLDGILTSGDSGGLELLEHRVEGALEQIEAAYKAQGTGAAGLSTGLKRLDRLVGGLKSGKVYVLAARPAMGKTACVEGIAMDAARAGKRVAFFSLEMPTEDLIAREISRLTGIASDKINNGRLSDPEMDQVVRTREALAALPLHIDDTSTISVSGMRARARRLQRAQGLDLVVIDYLQLMSGETQGHWVNRTEEVGQITRRIKTNLARDLGVPVILLSQLNREVEKRDDKRPHLSDLRESGSVEQDADVVMFLYREEYYLKNDKPQRRANETDERLETRERIWGDRLERSKGKAEIIVAKQRSGPQGSVTVEFDGPQMRFHEGEDGVVEPQEEIPF